MLSLRLWLWVLVLGVLFVVLHRTFVLRMFRIATGEWGGNWSHALVVPLISAYFISQNRHRLAGMTGRVFWPGLIVLFGGLLSFAWCIYPIRNDMLQGYSMIVSLFGLVLFLLGPAMMRVLWFPIVYLALAVKVSDRWWEHLANKLQLVAAKASAVAIQFLGVDASVSGSTIEMNLVRNGQWVTEKLNVAEACSGLRMLMAFVALGAAVAYLTERAWWQRLIIVLLTVPIALAVNIGRVTVIALLSLFDKEMAAGDFHVFVGMLMLIPAAFLFWLVGWVLDRVVTYDDPPEGVDQSRRATPSELQAGHGLSGTPRDGGRGFIMGVVLTVVIGLEYGLLLAINRPEDLFGGLLSSGTAVALSVGGLAVLAWGFILVRRSTRPGNQSGGGGRSWALGASAGVLLAAVLGLNGVVQATKTVLVKQRIDVRLPLFRIPQQAGQWEMIHEDPPLNAESLEALGTKQYISRVYRDQSWPKDQPGGMARLHVAYYTGTPDTVPHVPERCFVAGGLQGVDKFVTKLSLSGQGYHEKDQELFGVGTLAPYGVRIPSGAFDATVFTFSAPDAPESTSNVLYFFVANGKILATPDRVRAMGFDPRDRYSYYCKVEIGMFGVADPTVAAKRTEAFLSVMMPEIMACLPDWIEVTRGNWPLASDGAAVGAAR